MLFSEAHHPSSLCRERLSCWNLISSSVNHSIADSHAIELFEPSSDSPTTYTSGPLGIMRAAFSIPRGFLPTPRLPHCRPRISSSRISVASRAIRANSTASANGNQRQDSSSSPSWTASRTLLVSALAAGLGYGYASYGQKSPQAAKKPQYGSPKDFEKV
jgi:hypothetical protein